MTWASTERDVNKKLIPRLVDPFFSSSTSPGEDKKTSEHKNISNISDETRAR